MRKGFTTVEWVVVIAICSILAIILWPIASAASRQEMRAMAFIFGVVPLLPLVMAIMIAIRRRFSS